VTGLSWSPFFRAIGGGDKRPRACHRRLDPTSGASVDDGTTGAGDGRCAGRASPRPGSPQHYASCFRRLATDRGATRQEVRGDLGGLGTAASAGENFRSSNLLSGPMCPTCFFEASHALPSARSPLVVWPCGFDYRPGFQRFERRALVDTRKHSGARSAHAISFGHASSGAPHFFAALFGYSHINAGDGTHEILRRHYWTADDSGSRGENRRAAVAIIGDIAPILWRGPTFTCFQIWSGHCAVWARLAVAKRLAQIASGSRLTTDMMRRSRCRM